MLEGAMLEVESGTHTNHRLFAKRPTQIAEPHHASIPLHTQNPPVPFLSWTKADAIMRLAASDGDEHVWFAATRVYREDSSAREIFLNRKPEFDSTLPARLLGNDLADLLECKFAIDTELSVEEFQQQHGFEVAFVMLFSAIEARNELERRRMIGWPKAMNEGEHKLADQLIRQHRKVRFDVAAEVRDRGVNLAFAASLDFKKFYQQFELIVKRFWAFIVEGRVFLLSTIPTGAVLPALFAQALSRTMLKLAIRKAGATHLVQSDSCIDNLRLCSDDVHALNAAWFELLQLCDNIGCTIGEMNPPPTSLQYEYVYLGMKFTFKDSVPAVQLADKSKLKLKRAIEGLTSHREMLVADIQAIFGHTVWATIVTARSLGKLYHVLKFIRRISKLKQSDTRQVWPSIIEAWTEELRQMSTASYTAPLIPNVIVTMFTDASESGWGVVIFNYGEKPIRVFAGKWSSAESKEHINMLELRALRIGARIMAHLKSEGEIIAIEVFVDNTTARAWASRRRAPTWNANQLAQEFSAELKTADIQLRSIDYVESARNFADAPSRTFSTEAQSSQLRPKAGAS